MAITIRATAPLNAAAVLPNQLVSEQLRIDGEQDRALVDSLRLAALRWVEKHVGVSLQRRGWKVILDGFPSTLRLPVSPVISVERVIYLDASGAAIDAAGLWRLADGVLSPAVGLAWPYSASGAGAVTIDFTPGYNDVLAEAAHLTTAALMMIQHLYEGGEAEAVPKSVAMLCDLDRIPVCG